jgi:putative ABC transport system substrate-binding protein
MRICLQRREFIAGLAGAAAWPLAADAQQRARQRTLPVIGYLSAAWERQPRRGAFCQGLGEQGFVEGRNVEIVDLYADTRYDRLRAIACGH